MSLTVAGVSRPTLLFFPYAEPIIWLRSGHRASTRALGHLVMSLLVLRPSLLPRQNGIPCRSLGPTYSQRKMEFLVGVWAQPTPNAKWNSLSEFGPSLLPTQNGIPCRSLGPAYSQRKEFGPSPLPTQSHFVVGVWAQPSPNTKNPETHDIHYPTAVPTQGLNCHCLSIQPFTPRCVNSI